MQSVFLINVMVGASMFSVPLASAHAGLALASLVIVLTAAVSGLTARYMLDAQGVVTALRVIESGSAASLEDVEFEAQASQIWSALTPSWGRWVWLAPLVTYLVTDLAVFSVFIPDTAAHVLGSEWVGGATLAALALAMTPLAATSLRKTTCLQLTLLLVRHAALAGMLAAAWAQFSSSPAVFAPGDERVSCVFPPRHSAAPAPHGPAAPATPGAPGACSVLPVWRPAGLPLVLPSAVYALVNQQYVPAIYAPVGLRHRADVGPAASSSVHLVAAYLLALAWTGVLAFDGRTPSPTDAASPFDGGAGPNATVPGALQPLYSLTFSYLRPPAAAASLMLTPAVALLSTFPLVAITLRDAYLTIADDLVACRAARRAGCGGVETARLSDAGAAGVTRPADADSGAPGQPAEAGEEEGEGGVFAPAAASLREEGASLRRPRRSPARAAVLRLARGPGTGSPAPAGGARASSLLVRAAFACLAVLPSVALALVVHDFGVLVVLTGGLGGVFFMLVAPSLLVLRARQVRRRVATALLRGGRPDDIAAELVRAASILQRVAGPTEAPACFRMRLRCAACGGAPALAPRASGGLVSDAVVSRLDAWASEGLDAGPWLVLGTAGCVLAVTVGSLLP